MRVIQLRSWIPVGNAVILAAMAAIPATPALAAATTSLMLTAEADTLVRTDLDVRRNDNHGMQQYVMVGTNRGGDGRPWGAPDAMRTLLRFDLSGLPAAPLLSARLEIRHYAINAEQPREVFRLQVHRIVPSGSRTPWLEGNGFEFSEATTVVRPSDSVFVDEAYGVAWAGLGDNPAPDAANNTTQPEFDASVEASILVDSAVVHVGDVLQWDLTGLVKRWLSGAIPNLGVMLRDPTSNGFFREIYLAARDGARLGAPDPMWFGPPQLLLRFQVEPTSKDECMRGRWKDFTLLNFKNQGDCISYLATHGRNRPAITK